MRLVERTTREVHLTSAGTQLATRARDVTAELDAALRTLRALPTPPLRVAWAWAGLGEHTVPLLRSWREHHESTPQLTQHEDPLRALGSGQVDAAIVRSSGSAPPLPGSCSAVRLHVERLVAAVATAHPWPRSTRSPWGSSTPGPLPSAAARPRPRPASGPGSDVAVDRPGRGDRRVADRHRPGRRLRHHRRGDHVEPQDSRGRLPLAAGCAPVEVSLVLPADDAHPLAAPFAAFAAEYLRTVTTRRTPPFILTGGPGGA